VTKAEHGRLIVAVWNIVNPGSTGAPKTVKLDFKGIDPETRVSIRRLDDDHGDTLGLYKKMGSPRYPTKDQIDDLREQSTLPEPEFEDLTDGALTLDLPVNALVLVQVR
jgi:xylan 1,4-beta-xylosidase